MKIPGRLTGPTPLVQWLNDLCSLARSCVIKSGVGYRVKSGPDGTTLEILGTGGVGGKGGTPSQSTLFKIAEISGNYLKCNKWDGSAWEEDFTYVARPYELRNSEKTGETIDGQATTYSYSSAQGRTATNALASEYEIIIPRYIAGQYIQASKVAGGDCAPYRTAGQEILDPDGNKLEWVDDNRGGRAWARKYA